MLGNSVEVCKLCKALPFFLAYVLNFVAVLNENASLKIHALNNDHQQKAKLTDFLSLLVV